MSQRDDRMVASRRTALKTISSLAALAVTEGATSRARAAAEEITIYTWETYHDDDWLKEWTAKTGVKVNAIRTGATDETYAKLRSGAVEVDIVYFDIGSIPRFADAKLIAPIDATRVANTSNITGGLNWRDRCTVGGKLMAIPYNWGTQPLMFNTAEVQPKPESWGVLWDEKFAGKVNLPDASDIVLPMVALYAGVKDPYNLSDGDFKKVADVLRKLRPQLRSIARGFDDAVAIYASGDDDLGYCQNITEVFELQKQQKSFDFSFPKEGTPTWIDCSILTPKGADRKVVYDFINDNLTTPWQTRFVKSSLNNGVLSASAARTAGLPDDVLAKTNILNQDEPGFWQRMSLLQNPESIDRRLELWNSFKAGTL